MIKITDGELKDLLPPVLKNDPEVIAYSAAVQWGTQLLLKFSRRTMMYAAIDEQPEEILDYMAVEIRAQYYEQNMDIETKRNIIKNSLAWYMKAGTQESVDELVQTIFGEGESVPWYDFDGEPGTPGTFDIITSARMEESMYEKFNRIIKKAKNQSSMMRYITVEHSMEDAWMAGIAGAPASECTVTNDINVDNQDQAIFLNEYVAVTDETEAMDNTVVGGLDATIENERKLKSVSYILTSTELILTETMDETIENERKLQSAEYILTSTELILAETMDEKEIITETVNTQKAVLMSEMSLREEGVK